MNTSHMATLLVVLMAVCIQGADVTLKPASAYFNICPRSHPNFDECLRNTVEQLRPFLVKGNPELDIGPLDPLNIPSLEYHDKTRGFQFRGVYTNITVHGIKEFKLLSIIADKDKLLLDMNVSIPTLWVTSYYEMNGKIMQLPLNGKGDSEFNFTEVIISARLLGKVLTRGDVEHLMIQDVQWTVDVTGAKLRLNNLFNRNPILGAAANSIFNENWREAFDTYRHLAMKSLGIICKDKINRVLQKYPLEELYPQ